MTTGSPHDSRVSQAELFTPAPLPIAELDDRERLACLRLIRSENIGPVTFRELINVYGGAAAAIEALPEMARRAGRARPLKVCPSDVAEAELAAAARAGARPVFTIEPGYPPALAAVDAPPPLLYVRGEPNVLGRDMVAIVGSRECSAAGITMAQILAKGIGDAGYVVVSGLARGIDGAAHRTSLSTGTVAVLAGGIDHVYPPENRTLFDEIPDAGGAIVTEMWPGYQPRAQDFPRRNRIISGVSRGIVVIEATRRSGGLVTARYAGEQGREVFAVPGHPLDPRAEGTNHLIRNGATMVVEANDVLEALGPITGRAPLRFANAALPAPRTSDTPPDASRSLDTGAVRAGPSAREHDGVRARVLAALGPAPVNVDLLVRVTNLPSRAVQIALVELDLAGHLERHGGQLVSRKM